MRFLKIIFFCHLILHFSSVLSYSYECHADLYDDISLEIPKTNIAIYDTVFLKIECSHLPMGENTLNVNWINPKNKIYTHDKNTFVVHDQSPWVNVFSFKLIEKGPFARSFTNSDFNSESYGVWTVNAYLRGERILSKQFNLH